MRGPSGPHLNGEPEVGAAFVESSLAQSELIDQLKAQLSDATSATWIHESIPLPPRPFTKSRRVIRRYHRALEVRAIAEDCRSRLVSLCGETPPAAVDQPHVFGARRRVPDIPEGESHADRMHRRLLKQATRLVSARRQHLAVTGARLD